MSTWVPLEQEMLASAVYEALKAYRKVRGTPENLLEGLLLVQEKRSPGRDDESAPRRATNEVLLSGLKALGDQHEAWRRVLEHRFLDGLQAGEVAGQLEKSPYADDWTANRVYKAQADAIETLAHILYRREMALRQEKKEELAAGLPSPNYDRLFGLDEAQAELAEILLAPDAPWVVVIAGIGGIGKTALADAVARRVMDHFRFAGVIWHRVEAEGMSGTPRPGQALTALLATLARALYPEMGASMAPDRRRQMVANALRRAPYLIVVDNLEEDDVVDHLLDDAGLLANPGKLLLTTRARPGTATPVYTHSLDELPRPDAVALMRHHARTTHVTALDDATEADLDAVYHVTGGNPLVLRLVVSLLRTFPLPQVLSDLDQAHIREVADLYRHIYWQTWQTLSDGARDLLLAMPLAGGSGAGKEQLLALTELDEPGLWRAVQELQQHSLLEARGGLHERRYGIHRLTEAFLQTEIIHWPPEEA